MMIKISKLATSPHNLQTRFNLNISFNNTRKTALHKDNQPTKHKGEEIRHSFILKLRTHMAGPRKCIR